jgi:hypothetical protein
MAQEEPIMANGPFGSLNTVFWDPNNGAYRCFSRLFRDRPFRDIETAVSADFREWSAREPFRGRRFTHERPVSEAVFSRAALPIQ